VGGSGGRIDLEGGVDLTNGRDMLAALVVDDPQEMQGVEMPGLDREDPAILCLGFRQPAGLMHLQRRTEERRRLGRCPGRSTVRHTRLPPE
jgi:hypothetical protein